jgi:hypothetical protein
MGRRDDDGREGARREWVGASSFIIWMEASAFMFVMARAHARPCPPPEPPPCRPAPVVVA